MKKLYSRLFKKKIKEVKPKENEYKYKLKVYIYNNNGASEYTIKGNHKNPSSYLWYRNLWTWFYVRDSNVYNLISTIGNNGKSFDTLLKKDINAIRAEIYTIKED